MYFSATYWIYMLPGIVLVMFTSWYVKSAYRKWSKVPARSRISGYEAAQRLITRGGLYGVHIGGAFFGESMFSAEADASKIALVYLVARLKAGGFTLLDTQFITPHLASLGATEINREDYHVLLEKALQVEGNFQLLPLDVEPEEVLQLVSHTS